MIKVGIIGANGYTGGELARIIALHKETELTLITSRQFAGQRMDEVYPALKGGCDLVFEEYDLDVAAEKADFFFMALPHKLPMEFVPGLLERGKKIVDLSADFRFRNQAAYEAFYLPHISAHLLPEAVYGLSEMYTEEIKTARIIGNPGCFPTSILIPLLPLVRAGLVDSSTIIADSKSGVSGAGRTLSLKAHFCEANESIKAYSVANHRHTPEIEEVLTMAAGKDVIISFTPHLVPMTRGMLSTIYVNPVSGITVSDIYAAWHQAYAGRRFVRIMDCGGVPDTAYVRNTNCCDIAVHQDKRTGRLIIMSAIDNLLKGASGQAVQNMNIMLGFDEGAGLAAFGMPV